MHRAIAVLPLLCLPLTSLAQEVAPELKIRVGYAFTGEYTKRDGTTGSARGPEIALTVPLTEFQGFGFALEPSFLGGGRLVSGGDSDLDVYRLTLTATRNLPRGAYVKAGFGVAHVHDRANQVNAASGIVGQFGFGVPVAGIFAKLRPTAEINLFAADNGQLRSVSLGLVGRF